MKFGNNILRVVRVTFFIIVSFYFTGQYSNSWGQFNPNPDCDIDLIIQTLTDAGLHELSSCHTDCRMYFFNPEKRSGLQAQGFAESLGGNLATISSQEQNDCLSEAILGLGLDLSSTSGVAWIGINWHANSTTAWSWKDGSPVEYTNWATGQETPSNAKPSFGYFNVNSGLWRNGHYNSNRASIIQIDLCPKMNIVSKSKCLGVGGSKKIGTNGAKGGAKPYVYTWSNGPSGSNENFQYVNPSSSETYTLNVTDRYGCTADSLVYMTVIPDILFDADIVDAHCGVDDGEIHIVDLNFTPFEEDEVTYSINNGSTYSDSPDFYNLAAGTYPARVKLVSDGGPACVSSTVPLVVGLDGMEPADFEFDDFCYGSSNGASNIAATGGVFSFSTPPTDGATINPGTGEISNETAGATYTVNHTVTYTVGGVNCPLDYEQEVYVIPPPSISVSTVNSTCGDDNGKVNITVNNPSGSYTYSIDNGNTSQSTNVFENLSSGTYNVIVSEVGGCSTLGETVTVSSTQVPTVSIQSHENVSCFNGNNGTATAVATGGSGPYTYSWSNGASGSTVNNLTPNTYTVTVEDSDGCTDNVEVTITQPTEMQVSITSEDSHCDLSNGEATASVTGGTGPYTYSWSSGGSSSTINGLTANTYTVTVTDANGCTKTESVVIDIIPGPTVSIVDVQDVLCFGENSGSAEISTSGGTGNVTVSWSSGGSSLSESGLTEGNYTVTVTDGAGCVVVENIEISQPDEMILDSNVTSFEHCNQSDGAATVSATGGTSPYTYSWSSGSTGPSGTGLASGNHTVTVTDANGCEGNIIVTIDAIDGPSIDSDISINHVSCNGGSDGSITISAEGGSGNYTYSWSPSGGNQPTVTGLNAGSYVVVITDESGCTIQETIEVTEPDELSISVTESDVSCYGEDDGSINISVSGGTGNYNYSWSNGETTQNISNLESGTYTVEVTDGTGCSTTETAVIVEPADLMLALASTNAICGTDNGTATVEVVSGGVGTFTYNWGPLGGNQTTSTASNLAGGSYTVTVTDGSGCVKTGSIDVEVTPAPSIVLDNSTDVLCFGDNTGSASISVSGGTTPYTYSWSNGQNTSTATNLTSGNYTVTIEDADGCSDELTIIIDEPEDLEYTFNIVDTDCDTNNGTATVSVTGGVPGYTYNWVPGGSTSATASDLGVGTYVVSIQDQNGCVVVGQTQVGMKESPVIDIANVQDVSCYGENDGVIGVNATGGTPAYQYFWSPDVSSSSTATDLSAGQYTVVVKDASGCEDEVSVVIADATEIHINSNVISSDCGRDNGVIEINVSGGAQSFTYNWTPAVSNSSIATQLGIGTYEVVVSDDNGCSEVLTFTITEEGTFPLDVSPDEVTIIEGDSVHITVGSPDYIDVGNILWYPSDGLDCDDCDDLYASPQDSTVYYVIVTSEGGCEAIDSVIINVLPKCGEVFVPNIFSPNNDGLNDFMCVLGNCIVGLKFEIFNRWGERVFMNTETEKCWDGTYKGNPVQPGVYFYNLRATMREGDVITKSGNITVVR